MSITMDRIEPSGFSGGIACVSIFEPPPSNGERKEEEQHENWCSSSSTSSIGRNSDLSERSSDGEDNEVQSVYNGPLDVMDSLEEVLPIRGGISKFYNGKSKSFTSLADVSSTSSIKDVGKQENAYSRRRRNLLATNHIWDKNRSSRRSNGCGISKKPLIACRSTLALAVAMSTSESSISRNDDSNSKSPSPLPPLYPRCRATPWRSYSVADLQQCRTEVTLNANRSLVSDKSEHDKLT